MDSNQMSDQERRDAFWCGVRLMKVPINREQADKLMNLAVRLRQNPEIDLREITKIIVGDEAEKTVHRKAGDSPA